MKMLDPASMSRNPCKLAIQAFASETFRIFGFARDGKAGTPLNRASGKEK